MTVAQKSLRRELGGFMSTICFKAAVTGLEEALGEKAAAIALIAAGRKRGKQLAEEFHLVNQGHSLPLSELTDKLRYALGTQGTRLCLIEKIEEDGEVLKVYARETVCSEGEEEGSPRRCTYTLGALQGFLEAVRGQRLRGRHTESVLRGSDYDVLEYRPLT
jgi:predicted hydrocarbon binding protein